MAVNLRSSQFIPKETAYNTFSEKLNNKNRNLQMKYVLRKDIEKKVPEYFKLTTAQKTKINKIQKN